MKFMIGKILFCSFALIGCQKRDDEGEAEKSSLREEKRTNIRRFDGVAKPRDPDIVRSVSLSAERLQKEGEIITSSLEALKDFEHPQFSQKMGKNALDKALRDPRSLFEILKDDDSQWNSDSELKKSVIGTASLLTGLIGVPNEETVSGLPDLFLTEEYETQRDMLMLQAAKQAVRLAESKKKISKEGFSKWLLMAQSSNEITRYTALVLFDLVAPTNEQAYAFFDSYYNEKNQIIVQFSELKKKRNTIHSK